MMADSLLLAIVQLTQFIVTGKSVLIVYSNETNVQWINSQLHNLDIPTILWNANASIPKSFLINHPIKAVLLLSNSEKASDTIYDICQDDHYQDYIWIYAADGDDDPLSTKTFWTNLEYPQKTIILKSANDTGCLEMMTPNTQTIVGFGGNCSNFQINLTLAKQEWKNLNDRMLIVTTVDRGPIQGITVSNGKRKGHGMIFDILNMMTTVYNFRYTTILSPNNFYGSKLSNGSWDGMMQQIILKKAHMTAAVFQITEERSFEVDFSIEIFEEVMSILQRRPSADKSGNGIFKPFSAEVWILLLITMAVVPLATFTLTGISYKIMSVKTKSLQTLGDCFWTIFRLLFYQSGNTSTMHMISSRILLTVWGIFTVVVTSMYTANLTAFLTVPIYNIKIKQLKDLLINRKTRWIVKKSAAFISEIESQVTTSYSSLLPDLISGHAISVSKDEDAALMVLENNYVYLQKETTVESIILNDLSNSSECRYAVGLEKFFRTPTCMAFPKGSSYKNLVDDFVVQLRSYGIIDFIYSKYYPTVSDTCQLKATSSDDTQPFTLKSFDYTYMLLAAGLGLAVIATAIERLCTRQKIESKIEKFHKFVHVNPNQMNKTVVVQ
ncbi:hypothetical protein CHUAL_000845 [Chamberlinius hualienensis]